MPQFIHANFDTVKFNRSQKAEFLGGGKAALPLGRVDLSSIIFKQHGKAL